MYLNCDPKELLFGLSNRSWSNEPPNFNEHFYGSTTRYIYYILVHIARPATNTVVFINRYFQVVEIEIDEEWY